MIKVGDYIRTKSGCIGEVININNFREKTAKVCVDFNLKDYVFIGESEIVSHSPKLINLIEVGDIVRIRTGLYSSFMEFIDNEDTLLILQEQVKKFWIIEEILTHELYEANCYKVGGEDE